LYFASAAINADMADASIGPVSHSRPLSRTQSRSPRASPATLMPVQLGHRRNRHRRKRRRGLQRPAKLLPPPKQLARMDPGSTSNL